MTPSRRPSGTIVVDANIVVSAVLGRRTGHALATVAGTGGLVISERAARETVRVVAHVTRGGREEMVLVEQLLALIDTVPDRLYRADLEDAARTLRDAVASRNGSTADAHVLALAWTLDADIWSHDRDFAGTGWPSWSSANLLARLDSSAAAGPRPG